LTENQRVILYLGRIHKVKGLALLARSFASLAKDLPDTRLVIAGPDDGYLQALKKLVISLKLESTIIFTGPVYGQDKLAVYVDADVYVLPSFYDVFGVTVLEACACGIPVIVSDCSGVADIVGNQAGLIFSRNEAQLKQSLLKMLTADKLRREYSKKGKLLVRNTYNWREIAKQMEVVYDEIL
jgi:glycosyltransferase involved in cell wall biosynthesis